MEKLTLNELADTMSSYNRSVAPGSECQAWQLFCEDVWNHYGIAPWGDDVYDVFPSKDFVEYWEDVINGTNPEWDSRSGCLLDE